jgi:hypothetical protein
LKWSRRYGGPGDSSCTPAGGPGIIRGPTAGPAARGGLLYHRHPWMKQLGKQYTDKKENQIFLIYKEIQGGAVAK